MFVGHFCPPGSNPYPDPDPQHCCKMIMNSKIKTIIISYKNIESRKSHPEQKTIMSLYEQAVFHACFLTGRKSGFTDENYLIQSLFVQE